jgi:signal transduction histidine kinase
VVGVMAMFSRTQISQITLNALEPVATTIALGIARRRLERQRDEFLSAAAHDLKTPLTSIRGLVQLLQRRARPGGVVPAEQVAGNLEQIVRSTGKMSGLIDELLDISRRDSNEPITLHPAPTDLVRLARDVAADCQRSTRQHKVCLETAETELIGNWDASRLERAIGNLVTNAIKYSPGGGDVTITVQREGEWAALTVSDNGIGIPPADVARIFERFQRAGNVPARIVGTGIGLNYVRDVVEEHGGQVTADSEQDRGSTFTMRLPLAASEEKR